MKDGTKVKEKNKSKDLKQTIDYIFNIDQKEVFDNEINSLKEDIQNNELYSIINPAILNFILFKSNELKLHATLAQGLKNKSKSTLIKEYLEKENFLNTQRHISDYLKNGNFMKKTNGEDFEIKEEISNGENEVNSFFKYETYFDKNQKDTQHYEFNDIKNILGISQTNFPLLDPEKNLDKMEMDPGNKVLNTSNKNIIVFNSNQIQKKRIVYKLKISYLDGSDNSAQLCSIETDEKIDLNTFINQLKKQLGIYEYARFKILLVDQSNDHKIYLQDISQLKQDEINEIKIVPYY